MIHKNYLFGIIIVLFIFVHFYTLEKFKYCTDCDLDARSCYECENCGWCIDKKNNGKCLEGKEYGPYKNIHCKQWYYSGGPFVYEYKMPEYNGYFDHKH